MVSQAVPDINLKNDRVSFRQVGKIPKGTMRQGPLNTAFSRMTVPSIPSKFETILYQNFRHQRGFLGSSHRFAYNIEDVPGPGLYNTSKESIDSKSTESYSKKGYGNGFISKTDRFNKWFFVQKNITPGPIYVSHDSPDVKMKGMKKNKQPSSMFIPPKNQSKLVKTSMPGPCQYTPQIPQKNNGGAVSSFKSTMKKSTLDQQNSQSPPPNAYNPEKADKLIMQNTFAKSNICKSSFAPPTNSKKIPVNLYDPFDYAITYNQTPGPGEYDVQFQEKVKQEETQNNLSAAFVQSNINRFGKIVNKRKPSFKTPGPGQYNVYKDQSYQIKSLDNSLTNTSFAFNSMAERDYQSVFSNTKLQGVKNPGPAYYGTVSKNPNKKSFHLNVSGEWIS